MRDMCKYTNYTTSGGKDKITENIDKFQKFIENKINVLHINKKNYFNDLKKSYQITKFPFLVHDFVGKYQLSKFFRSKGCKVFFAGDGADELFGGYQAYSKINWDSKEAKNLSPYSNFNIPGSGEHPKLPIKLFF